MLYAIVNAHGLNEGVLEMDTLAAAAHPLRPGCRLHPITLAEHHALKFLGHAARHAPKAGWHLLPERHVRAWNRVRGANWAHSLEMHKHHRETVATLAAAGMLAAFAPPPDDLAEPPAPERRRRYAIPAIEVRPGLWLREMTEAEASDCAGHLIAAQLYDEDAEMTRVRVDEWYHDALCWPMAVVWRGEPLEYELYHFLEDRPQIIKVSFNVRLRRDRPYRFWRQVFTPYFEHLQGLGITTIESRTRSDRPEYIAGLVQTYGAKILGGDDKGTNLSYSIATSVAMATGWPERRTLGAAWRWSRGEVVVREADPGEYEACRAVIASSWGSGHPRLGIALRVFDDWTALDSATVLVSEVSGQLTDIRLARHRQGTSGGKASVTRWRMDLSHMLVAQGCAQWALEVGYTDMATFMPLHLLEKPEVARQFAAAGSELVQIRAGFAEYRQDLAAALARPESAWIS